MGGKCVGNLTLQAMTLRGRWPRRGRKNTRHMGRSEPGPHGHPENRPIDRTPAQLHAADPRHSIARGRRIGPLSDTLCGNGSTFQHDNSSAPHRSHDYLKGASRWWAPAWTKSSWNWAKSTCAWWPGGVSKRTSNDGLGAGRTLRRKSVTAV